MKPQRATILCFSVYLLATASLSFFFVSTQQHTSPLADYGKAEPLIVIFQGFGYAAKETADAIEHWISYVAFSTLLNLLFFMILKFAVTLSIRRFLTLALVALSISFVLYILLHSVLQWLFGFYFSIAFILFSVTYFVIAWEGLFKSRTA